MKYYIIENGNPVGPFEVAELVAKGLKAPDLVWTEGYPDWVAAGSVEEIAMALNCTQTPPSMPAMPQNQFGNGGYQQQCPPSYGQGYGQPYQQPYGQHGYPQQVGGWQQQQMPYEIPPKSWLAESIIMTLCCCTPIGIYCIVKAASVNSLWNGGQYEEARRASDVAKKWLIIGLITGIILSILSVFINIAFTNSISDLYNI